MERLLVLALLIVALVTTTLLQGCNLFGLGGSPTTTPAPSASPETTPAPSATTHTSTTPDTSPPEPPEQSCHQSHGPLKLSRRIDGNNRTYITYLPKRLKGKAPLWLVMPGAYDTADWMMKYIDLQIFADKHAIAFVVFQGFDFGSGIKFNVGLGSQPVLSGPSKGPYDINFVKSVLDDMLAIPCIDSERIHCTGWSNGGRFCGLLASEMSDKIASIGMISSLRFPKPMHAQRAIPVLAFHGTADPVNPWPGHGDPTYWNESVLDAFGRWVDFNGCNNGVPMKWKHLLGKVYRTELQQGCRSGAVVQLVKLEGFGHPWPRSKCRTNEFKNPHLGPCNMDVDANDLLLDFFKKHPLPPASKEQSSILSEWSSKFPRPLSPHLPIVLAVLGGGCLLAVSAALSRCGRRKLHESCDESRARKPLDCESSEVASLLHGF